VSDLPADPKARREYRRAMLAKLPPERLVMRPEWFAELDADEFDAEARAAARAGKVLAVTHAGMVYASDRRYSLARLRLIYWRSSLARLAPWYRLRNRVADAWWSWRHRGRSWWDEVGK
jgi:hypothetical protein